MDKERELKKLDVKLSLLKKLKERLLERKQQNQSSSNQEELNSEPAYPLKNRSIIYRIKSLIHRDKISLIWTVVGVIFFAFMTASYGAISVLYFEQSLDGGSAVYEDCLLWNEKVTSAEQCIETTGGKNTCCLIYGNKAEPLGKRLSDVIKYNAFLGGAIGFGVGAIIGSIRQNKRRLA